VVIMLTLNSKSKRIPWPLDKYTPWVFWSRTAEISEQRQPTLGTVGKAAATIEGQVACSAC
jgi:hypothetical protein